MCPLQLAKESPFCAAYWIKVICKAVRLFYFFCAYLVIYDGVFVKLVNVFHISEYSDYLKVPNMLCGAEL